jgi:hypothetical protein
VIQIWKSNEMIQSEEHHSELDTIAQIKQTKQKLDTGRVISGEQVKKLITKEPDNEFSEHN